MVFVYQRSHHKGGPHPVGAIDPGFRQEDVPVDCPARISAQSDAELLNVENSNNVVKTIPNHHK